MVQLSHPYMTIGKTTALSRWIFVGKVIPLLFNMLSMLVILFLPRSKCILISWLQLPSAVIVEPKKIVCHCFHCFPIYLQWSDGTSIFKSRDISLLTKVRLVKAMVFPVVMYRYESWTIKKSWAQKNWWFWTVVLEKTLESPLGCQEMQAVHPEGDQSWVFIGRTDVEDETPILWPINAKNWLIWKDPDAGKDWGQEEKGMTED